MSNNFNLSQLADKANSTGNLNSATIGVTTPAAGKFTSVTNTGLTSGRVTYASTSGLLADSANMTFSGTALTLANDASISGLTVGRGANNLAVNTVIGYTSGASITSGTGNSFLGYQAGNKNTTGASNTFVGGAYTLGAGYNNTTGGSNTAIGTDALASNTTASNNTAVGYQAGYSNTTGSYNTFLGYLAGYSSAVSSAVAGNTCVGPSAGYSLTTGSYNTFIGSAGTVSQGSGGLITTGNYNTILGTYNGNQGGLDIRTASNYIVLSDGAGNPRQVIDSSGNVGIGTSSPYTASFTVGGSKWGIFNGNIGGVATTSNQGVMLGWNASNGSGDANIVWGTYYTGTAPLTFSSSDGSTLSEKMRIDSSGNLLVGTTSALSGNTFKASSGAAATFSTTTTSNFSLIYFYNGSYVGSITTNGSVTAYNTSSDYRLKENIVDAPSGNINDIKVRSFDWIADGTHQTYGMVAQELVEVAPYAVHQPQDPEEMMAVDYSKLVPMMIKEIQDLKQRIATLESK